MNQINLYAAFVLLVALNAATYAEDRFGPATNYPTGDSPESLFIADLDGDRDKDLAVANWGSFDRDLRKYINSSVSVLLNNGDGQLAPKMDYETGINPQSLFIADLDMDGDNDIAVANFGSDNVSVLLNNGDGQFALPVFYDTGQWPVSLFIADLDGDGDNDLAVANRFSDTVSVLLNNGDGQFATKVDYPVGIDPFSVFSTDLDVDGDNDLAVTNNRSNTVSVLLNLSRPVDLPGIAGDFDGDNEVDLSDFVRFLDVFGGTATPANSIFDLDGNGEIGLSDFVIFLDNFGRTQ